MALSLTPLAPDPGYERTTGFFPKGPVVDPSPLGCVRPEAKAIAIYQSQGTMASLLQDGLDKPTTARKPPKPKNYSLENRNHIKQLAAEGKRRREGMEQSSVPCTASGKYDYVVAKVRSRPLTAPPPTPKSPGECGCLLSTSTKSFLEDNVRAASSYQIKTDPRKEQLKQLKEKRERDFSQYKRGQLPQYLVARQQEWKKAEEERLASRPDPSIPPGHSLMSQEERLHTLDVLKQHESVLTKDLRTLPLCSDTYKLKQKRAQLEARLVEIEDAIKIFSRSKVYVKLDE